MNKKVNFILIFIAIVGGIIYGTFSIQAGDGYETLIRLSIIPVMLLPYIAEKLFKFKFSSQMITIYLIFVFFAHFLGSIVNLYHIVPNYDKIMHFMSGILSALVAIVILISVKEYKKEKIFYNIIFIIAITLSIAAMWEFYEFTADSLFGKDAQNVYTTGADDTMIDMIAAFIGSVLVSIKYYFEIASNKLGVVTSFIEEVGGKDARRK